MSLSLGERYGVAAGDLEHFLHTQLLNSIQGLLSVHVCTYVLKRLCIVLLYKLVRTEMYCSLKQQTLFDIRERF